ncbi:MAG: Na(+)-translocating NADH-quinone reductase subunit C, partial [Candidatus Latescibacterota bacterium]|nr:Na(+)-translocating NADH-quinone reductase subunit C [Candidatus Latescibacterota bacterium]
MANDSVGRTFGVALGVCLVCSVLVSVAAVSLRPIQAVNKALDKKRNILVAAGFIKPGEVVGGERIEELYKSVEPRIVDLATGEYAEVDPAFFDQR